MYGAVGGGESTQSDVFVDEWQIPAPTAEARPAEEDVITTIRVSGIPLHVTETEFNCWFLFAPGFEAATLVPPQKPGKWLLGWARFSTVEEANHAIMNLHERQMTQDQAPDGALLLAEMARSNYKQRNPNKRWRAGDDQAAVPRGETDSGVRGVVTPAAKRLQQSLQQTVPTPPPPVRPVRSYGGAVGAPPAVPIVPLPQPPQGGCSTLFLKGLPGILDEQELTTFLGSLGARFERLKTQQGNFSRGSLCWAKFASVGDAEKALQAISLGHVPPSFPRQQQIQAEFSKNDLDAPRGR